ncbi:MAG: SufD family Fe-S cluster assembly protein, partial [Rhizobiales bacterium]|nr:SufD family Fe-S cluster assembly protein [Hyphomicrobiales bacterium]
MNIQTTQTRTAAETALIDTFAARLPALPGDKAVTAKRREAIAALEARGLPNRKIEAWHYTDLRRLLTTVPAFDDGAKATTVAPLLEGSVVLPILNGKAGKAPSVEGVTIAPAAEKMADGTFAPALQPSTDDDAVGAINAALAADGWFLDIAGGATPEAPIELQSAQAGGQVHTRLAARVGEGAKATVLERHVGTGDALASSVTNIVVGDGAELRWLIVQEQPRGATYLGQFNAWIGKEAKLTLFVMN